MPVNFGDLPVFVQYRKYTGIRFNRLRRPVGLILCSGKRDHFWPNTHFEYRIYIFVVLVKNDMAIGNILIKSNPGALDSVLVVLEPESNMLSIKKKTLAPSSEKSAQVGVCFENKKKRWSLKKPPERKIFWGPLWILRGYLGFHSIDPTSPLILLTQPFHQQRLEFHQITQH